MSSNFFSSSRCLYIAHSYLLTKKWKEATALYERVLKYADEAISLYKKLPDEQVRLHVLRTKSGVYVASV